MKISEKNLIYTKLNFIYIKDKIIYNLPYEKERTAKTYY